jgi:hypothetical protein
MGALFFLLRRNILELAARCPLVCPPRLLGVDAGSGGRPWRW